MSELDKLRTEIFNFWFNLSEEKRRDLVQQLLSEKHLMALRLGTMDSYVTYGNFKEWVDQGYAKLDLDNLLDFLDKYRETDSVNKVYEILKKLSKTIEEYEEMTKGIEELKETSLQKYSNLIEKSFKDYFSDRCKSLSKEYLDIKKQFLEDIEQLYFASK
ncbi:MAG TPA: hypothetical protein EYP14_06705 [Planctomycetaceae bacterium]|nr:hypothetical protein [Planctomycetaceae bacterium]